MKPLGNGLINDTYVACETGSGRPCYVLQRINHHVFKDVALLQNNICAVTHHLRGKLLAAGETDVRRKVLCPVALRGSDRTYYHDEASDTYWRVTEYIPDAVTVEAVTPQSSRAAGEAFVIWCAEFAKVNNMEITVTISDDPAEASEEMKQYL